jgi:hypothetical protein
MQDSTPPSCCHKIVKHQQMDQGYTPPYLFKVKAIVLQAVHFEFQMMCSERTKSFDEGDTYSL